MEGNATLQLFNIPTVLVTLGVTAFIIADGKGRGPVAWVFLAVTLAIFAFPALLLAKSERAVRVPYAMKAVTAFFVGGLRVSRTWFTARRPIGRELSNQGIPFKLLMKAFRWRDGFRRPSGLASVA